MIRLIGDSATNGYNTYPMVFEGESEIQMRSMTATYGFDCLPFTYGELGSVIKSCDKLELIMGQPSFPADEQALWQVSAFKVFKRRQSAIVSTTILYAAESVA